MEKAQWSPINSEPTNTGNSPTAKKPHPGLTRLPINFSNGAPVRAKKQYSEPSKNIPKRPPVVKTPTPSGGIHATEPEPRSPKPREFGLTGSSTIETASSTPFATMSPDESTSERRLEGKRHEMAPNGRNIVSVPSSRAGTQTPKADHQAGVSTMSKRAQPPNPGPIQTTKQLYQAFNIAPPGNHVMMSDNQSNATKMSEPRQGSIKRTSGPRDTPAILTKDSPNKLSAEPREGHAKPVQDQQPIEIDEQSSSSDDDATHLPTGAGRQTEEAIEEGEGPPVDEPDHVAAATSLPDDHPIEWLGEAKEIYQNSLPPFVTKQKSGFRRTVEQPLNEGQQYAGKVEVVYRSWDSVYSFASIDVKGRRYIVKVFRGGATPYRPWLGPQTGFSETALAFSKQVPRGPKAWAAPQVKRVSLPKGWALKEDDERDDDYSPASRRKSFPVRRRRRLNYDLNEDEDELENDPFREEVEQLGEELHSEKSSIEENYAAPDPTDDQQLNSKESSIPINLINAVKKSLRVPKEKDVFQRPKQIKRRSIGGQRATTDSGGNKRPKHKADFPSDSEHSVPHKRVKATKAFSRPNSSTNPANPANVFEISKYESPTLDAHMLSPYKQAHTTLRIALIPYPSRSAIHRLRSCMAMSTFFSSVIGISGYKGDRDHIFGITATFDCKSDDDADKSMVIREDWQDSFDVFLETVDGAESWTEEGGKCGVAVSLLLTEE